MNHIDFKYVVLRNWEHLPYMAEVGEHSDLDLLVYDLEHFLEVFPHLERVYPHPRVQFKLHLDDGNYVQIDARSLGDNYYPYKFQENILKTRVWNKNGFFTPNPMHHRIALSYHVAHHKNFNKYSKYLGNLTPKDLVKALKQSKVGWVEPDDPTVGRFNPYFKGATSLVTDKGEYIEKEQFRFRGHNLADNEERILKIVKGPHFPKLISREGEQLRISHCGEPLSINNIPNDWLEQFIEIADELDRVGIVHRDIRQDNFMVKEGVIKLIDFGWARLKDEPEGDVPELLGHPNRCPLGFNDRFSMNRVIKQLKMEQEELWEKENSESVA